MANPTFAPSAQKGIWKHMRNDCLIPLCTEAEHGVRNKVLVRLESEVNSGHYSPRPIHGFLTTPKSGIVPRFVPVLHHEDVSVYAACVMAIESKLAGQRVDGTFGGWTLGGACRRSEKEELDGLISDLPTTEASIPASPYNPWAWFENWNRFWGLASRIWFSAAETSCFVEMDISNFYDSIDLCRLERELRNACPESRLAVDTLMYFLSTWNRSLLRYNRSSKGLPQDLIGDCSRVLANFYLVEFDTEFRAVALAHGSEYMRYADDMVICAPNEQVGRRLVHIAGEILHRLALSINAGKVVCHTKAEFGRSWSFDIMARLDSTSPAVIVSAVKQFNGRVKDLHFRRRETVLRRCVRLLSADLQDRRIPILRQALYTMATTKPGAVLDLSHQQMAALLRIAPSEREGIDTLARHVTDAPFTQSKLAFLRCLSNWTTQDPASADHVKATALQVRDSCEGIAKWGALRLIDRQMNRELARKEDAMPSAS